MKWGIVVDSGSDLKEKDFTDIGVDFTVAPLKIIAEDKEFVDDDNIDVAQLIKGISDNKKASQTACPSPGDFVNGFSKSDNVLCFTLTGGLSGTFNSARMAKDLVLNDNPSKNIFVCDTKSVGGHLVLMMEKALELIENNLSFNEVVSELEKYNKEIDIIFTMGSYENLIKTGRMSNLAGTIAKTLNIRLICSNTEEGKIEVVKKVRGIKSTYNKMVEMMANAKDLNDKKIRIHHCNNEESALYIKEKILAEFPNANITIFKCKGLTTFYAMDGGIIINY
ncbi:MAG: DegV family protein [Anaerorhabdus sp.]